MTDFQITQDQYDELTARLAALESHKHLGTDSLQVDQANLLNARFYGLFSRVQLTSAQVLALHTTPVTLVPAFGAASVIIVDSIDAKLAYNTTTYTGANALEFRYTDGSGTKVSADMASSFIDSVATAYDHVAGVVTELTPVANKPVVVAVPTANPAAGNSTITFITKYRVVTF